MSVGDQSKFQLTTFDLTVTHVALTSCEKEAGTGKMTGSGLRHLKVGGQSMVPEPVPVVKLIGVLS